jgi:type IV pilus assembly protein PilW
MKTSIHHRRGQRGLSLVEVMVSATLGLILLVVLIQVVISNRDAHRWQQNLSLLQENGRFAITKIAQVMRMTAYQGSTAPEWLLGPLSNGNGGLVPLGGTNDDTNGSDTLLAAYRGTADGFVKDCQGSVIAAGVTVINRFSVSAGGDLDCAVSTDGGTTWSSLAMVSGVEAMHVLYGVDSDSDGSANRYVGAADVTNMERVVSIRIGLLLVSRDDALVATVDGTVYPVLDALVHAGTGPGDRRARRVLLTTVQLRNHT